MSLKINEVEINDINVTPFKLKSKLQPDLFKKGDVLDSQIRMKLLDIADDFIKSLEVKWVKPLDIILTGSIVNYNWTKFSDIDVHVIYDFKKIYNKTDFVQDYFMTKRTEWNNSHDKLTIKGFPVELSVEDVNTPLQSSGIYSLNKNKWIKEPEEMKEGKINFKEIQKICAKEMTQIDELFNKIDNETDNKKLELLEKDLEDIIERLHDERKKGLKTKEKELSTGNIIWKIIKHMGYVDKVHDYINNIYDKRNTIKENKVIIINENQYNKLKNLYLTEAALSIDDVYNKYYKSIDREVFNAAVAADPTSYNQGKVVKVGNFVKWILKLYSNNSWKHGDSYETRDLLTKFIKYKSKLPIEKRDINRFNSIHNLYSIIQTLEGQGVKTQSEVKKEGAEVVYEDSEWKIVIPHTEEASCIYGAHTRWCTAGREDNMFNYYNKKGPLYININKVTGDKYQFHFESGSFMDAEDEEISPKEIGLSKGAIEYYKSIGKEIYFIYDYVGGFTDGFASVYLEGRGYNFINKQGKLLWEEEDWFDYAWDFFQGFAPVKIEGKGWNFINKNCEYLWDKDKWFDKASIFQDGFASVYLEGRGWNFINSNGELVWEGKEWFDEVKNFYEGFAEVKIEGKGWNFINHQGELVKEGDKWFDDVINVGGLRVRENGVWRVLKMDLNESLIVNSSQVSDIVNHLNKFYQPFIDYAGDIGGDGLPCPTLSIGYVVNNQLLQKLKRKELLDIINDKFRHFIKNDASRLAYYNQIIEDWLNKKVKLTGQLSVNVIDDDKIDKFNNYKTNKKKNK